MSEKNLFKPLKLGNIELSHRIVLAPLTRLRAPNNVGLKEAVPLYYKQRAQEPGTLLLTEATLISRRAGGYTDVPGIWSEEQLKVWKKVFQQVHECKSFIFVQLWNLGRMAYPSVTQQQGVEYVSASDLAITRNPLTGENDGEYPKPKPLSKADIKKHISDYVQAAKNAIEAGADGVEVHSANGYLPDQFLNEFTNTRTDEYGGSIENRARFVLEVFDAVVEAVGASKVAIRLSPWGKAGEMDRGLTPVPQFSFVVAELEKRRLQGKGPVFIDLVEPTFRNETYQPRSNHDPAGFIHEIFGGPIIRSGLALDRIEQVTDKNPNTLAAIGRYFISNPDLVWRLRNGAELQPYEREYFYSSGLRGYSDYENAPGHEATA